MHFCAMCDLVSLHFQNRNMKKILFTLTLLLPGLMPLQAQLHLPSNFFMDTLQNGLQVLVMEDQTVPLATIEIAVKNGSYTEDSAFNGLSHMFEHMFFKANKDIPSQEDFMKRVNELGISFNGTTGEERVNYFITLGSDKLQDGLRFMNSAIRYPLFLEQEMKNELPVVNGEFQRDESNPFFHLFDDMNRRMWGDNYYRKNPIGMHDVILTCTPEKMNVIKNKYYFPNNSILVVAGAVHHEDVFKQVENIYGDWQPSEFDPFQKWPIPEMKPLQGVTSYVTVNENAQIPVFAIGFHGPDTRNDVKSTYAADVFSQILGQASSRLQKELVETGLAYQVSVQYQTAKYTGPISIVMVPNPTMIDSAWNVLWDNVSHWADPGYFTDEQLQTAKTQLAVQDAYGKENTPGYVHTVTFWWASATISYYTGYNDNVQKVTQADIANYVKNYIIGQPHVNGLLVNPSMEDYVDFQTLGFDKPESK